MDWSHFWTIFAQTGIAFLFLVMVAAAIAVIGPDLRNIFGGKDKK
jgi:hypothetical protein